MKRIVIDHPDMFNLMWQGFHVDKEGTNKGEQLNTTVHILDKFEAISTDGERHENRAVTQVPCNLDLEDAEYQFLKKRLNDVGWSVSASRKAHAMLKAVKNAIDIK